MFGWFKKEQKKPQKRAFDAAKYNRLVASWLSVASSINEDLKGGIDVIRARARDLAQNEPMAKKYLSTVAANVVGSNGVLLQARVAENERQDKAANDAIEKAWSRFSKVGVYDVSGRMSRKDFERALIKCVARDGEALVVEHFDADNEFSYALQLVDINLLATTLNKESSGGSNAIIMGVEINPLGRAVAYHLYDSPYGKDSTLNRKTRRVTAENVIHLFVQDSPEQVRGYSWLHASMIRMNHLKKYQEFAIVASAVGASKMGFFKTPEGDGTAYADEEVEATGELHKEAAAGQFDVLPEGWDFTPFNPDYPHMMYAEFIKTAKRDISSGLDVSYHSLANDLEGVNFSSIRSGTLEEREQWKVVQDWFIGAYEERVYENWLRQALLNGAIKMISGKPLPATKREKFQAHEFLGRRWDWVDPLKDEQANTEALRRGGASPYKIAAQKGEDAEEILNDLEKFFESARQKKIPIEFLVQSMSSKNNDMNDVDDVLNKE